MGLGVAHAREDDVAEPAGDELAVVPSRRLQHVRVRAYDQIGPCFDELASEALLLPATYAPSFARVQPLPRMGFGPWAMIWLVDRSG